MAMGMAADIAADMAAGAAGIASLSLEYSRIPQIARMTMPG
jgi:hypothetical protein